MARFCLYSLLALPSVAYAAAVTSTITANPLETESTCPTRACTVHIPSGRVLKWMTFTPTSTFVAATVRVIVNNRTNATTTTTIFNTLPAGVEAPPTNADGTRIATVTSFAVTGGTTTVAYPSKWADYDSLVYWSGALTTKSTCTSVANATITLPPHPPIPQESLWVNGTMEAPDPEDPEGYFYSPYYEKYFAPVQTYAEELDEMALRDCVYTIASPPRALSGVKFLTTTETSIDTAGDGTAAPPSSPESTPAPAPSTTEVPPPPSNTEPAPPPSSSDTEPSQPPQQTSSPNPPALPVETGPSSSAQPPSPPAQSTAQQVPQPSNPSNPPTNPSNPPTNPENPQNPTTPTPQSPQNPTPENPQNPQNPTPENPTTPTPENPQNPQNPQNPTPENPATPSNGAPVVNPPNNSPTPENTPNTPNTPSNNAPAPIISVISNPPVVIIGTQPVTAAPGGSTFVVGSQTLTPGGTITVSGTTVALNPTAPVVVVNGESSSITAVQITTTIQRQTSAGPGSATGTGGLYPSTTEEAPSEFTGDASGVQKSWKGALVVGLLVGLVGGFM